MNPLSVRLADGVDLPGDLLPMMAEILNGRPAIDVYSKVWLEAIRKTATHSYQVVGLLSEEEFRLKCCDVVDEKVVSSGGRTDVEDVAVGYGDNDGCSPSSTENFNVDDGAPLAITEVNRSAKTCTLDGKYLFYWPSLEGNPESRFVTDDMSIPDRLKFVYRPEVGDVLRVGLVELPADLRSGQWRSQWYVGSARPNRVSLFEACVTRVDRNGSLQLEDETVVYWQDCYGIDGRPVDGVRSVFRKGARLRGFCIEADTPNFTGTLMSKSCFRRRALFAIEARNWSDCSFKFLHKPVAFEQMRNTVTFLRHDHGFLAATHKFSSLVVGDCDRITVSLTNQDSCDYLLEKIEFLDKSAQPFGIVFVEGDGVMDVRWQRLQEQPYLVRPGALLCVTVQFKAKAEFEGLIEDLMVFHLRNPKTGVVKQPSTKLSVRTFASKEQQRIRREELERASRPILSLHEGLERQRTQQETGVIVKGKPRLPNQLRGLAEKVYVNKLPSYPVPAHLEKLFHEKMDVPQKFMRGLCEMYPELLKPLDADNYCKTMSVLLWVEELFAKLDLQRRSLLNVCLLCRDENVIEVLAPNAVESSYLQPLTRARVCLSEHRGKSGVVAHSLIVERIKDETIVFRADKSQSFSEILNNSSADWDLDFEYNTLPNRREHQALSFVRNVIPCDVLFPTKIPVKLSQLRISPKVRSDVQSLYSRRNIVQPHGTPDQLAAGQDHLRVFHNANYDAFNAGRVGAEPTLAEKAQQRDREAAIRLLQDSSLEKAEDARETCRTTGGIEFFNENLNERQRLAVKRILDGRCRPLPYVIFGPPGTGKTSTLIEAVLQVFHQLTDSRILVCTPSNAAADLIVDLLWKSQRLVKGDLVRLNSRSRAPPTSEIVKMLSRYSEKPGDLNTVAHYRIIVSTLHAIGELHRVGVCNGHMTHVFVDEAGQATEPQTLIALGFVAGYENGQVVLAGDPLQLGPVVQSKNYNRNGLNGGYGLAKSMLQRLFETPLYARTTDGSYEAFGYHDPLVITKLVENFRAVTDLIELPSRLFYNNELVTGMDERVLSAMQKRSMAALQRINTQLKQTYLGDDENSFLRNDPNDGKGPLYPCVYIASMGREQRHAGDSSLFNNGECLQVVELIKELLNCGYTSGEIAVISPYRLQAKYIKNRLNDCGQFSVGSSTHLIKCCSVEEMQGQERPVIIISTVRTMDPWDVPEDGHDQGQDDGDDDGDDNDNGDDNVYLPSRWSGGGLRRRQRRSRRRRPPNCSFMNDAHRINVAFLSSHIDMRGLVAISRAKELMFIVGNAVALSQSPVWGRIVLSCLNNDSCIGPNLFHQVVLKKLIGYQSEPELTEFFQVPSPHRPAVVGPVEVGNDLEINLSPVVSQTTLNQSQSSNLLIERPPERQSRHSTAFSRSTLTGNNQSWSSNHSQNGRCPSRSSVVSSSSSYSSRQEKPSPCRSAHSSSSVETGPFQTLFWGYDLQQGNFDDVDDEL